MIEGGSKCCEPAPGRPDNAPDEKSSPTEIRMYTALSSIVAAGAAALLALGAVAAPRSPLPLADKSPGAVPVDVELVLAVDVSYSMDPEEQALQREGYITGITSRDFMQALRSGQHGKESASCLERA